MSKQYDCTRQVSQIIFRAEVTQLCNLVLEAMTQFQRWQLLG